ncbi:ABC transporter permease [Oceanibacterium hippocampi]
MLAVGAFLVAALAAVPVVVVLGALFVPAGEIWAHLASTVLPRYVANTAMLALIVALLTFTMGVTTAWLVTMCAFPGRRVFEWAMLLPLAMPAYIIAYTYTGLLDFAGPVQSGLREAFGWDRNDYWFPVVRSLPGAAVMLGLVLYPYVYILSRAAFMEQSVCALETSRTLGLGPVASFWRVALPLARPAIVTGLALALMETVGDFGTVQYFAVDTFTTGIYRTWIGLGETAAATQLAAVLTLAVMALLLVERWSRGRARFHHTSGRYRALRRARLRPGLAALAFVACLMPVLLGFVVPAGQLLYWALGTPLVGDYFRLVGSTLSVAVAAALIAVAVGVLLAYAQRLSPGRATGVAIRVASIGYAVPGAVMAVGVMLPFAWFDNRLDELMRSTFGVSTGLILSGTVIALLFAYVARFLAISFNTVESSLGKVTPNMDRAARSLGERPRGMLFRIHLPMISGGLLTAAMLVFVDVMKELPATLILRPFGFNTLAVKAFEMASDERLAEAAAPALAIVVAGIVPVIILSRAIARSRPGHHEAR